MAPIRAVPSDAPRFCAVPWRPPASFDSSGGADDMITLPSCDMSRPAPMPNRTSEIAKPAPCSVTSIVPIRSSAATTIATRPTWQTRCGDRRAAIFGPRSAAISIDTDIGNSFLPVSNASSPSTTWRYTGSTKNVPSRTSCIVASVDSPAFSGSIFRSARSSSVSSPRFSRRSSHQANTMRKPSPMATMNRTGESPNGAISWPPIVGGDLRRDPAPRARLEDRKHDRARGRSQRMWRRRRRASGGAPPPAPGPSACGRGGCRSTTTVSPAKTQRQLKYVVT